VIKNRQVLKIACLEEIGFHRGWLARDGLEASVARLVKSSYGAYLRKILMEI
jgi:glucose-1-phosphate thymidylyltransferase